MLEDEGVVLGELSQRSHIRGIVVDERTLLMGIRFVVQKQSIVVVEIDENNH